MAKETLYCYIRVSTDEQKLKDYSPSRQKDMGEKKAKELGMNCVIMEEGGASASQDNFDNRPVFFELLRLIDEGTAQHLFVFDQTRLSRNDITKAVILNKLTKKGVTVHTFSKKFDFNKAEDALTFSILQAIEAYESVLRKARFRLGYISGNKKGKFLKGIPNFGYDKDKEQFLVINEEEMKIFLQMVDMYLNQNLGTNQIARWLNQNNIPTKTSKILKNGYTLKKGVHNRRTTRHLTNNKWNPGAINSMFKNTVYYGIRSFTTGVGITETVECPAIISKETWDLIQAKRSTNAITKHKEDKHFYLLKGLLVCGCGNPMHGRIKENRHERSYRCNTKRGEGTNCESRGINLDKLNNIVWNAFSHSLHYHKAINSNIQQQLENPNEVKNRIKVLNKELEKLNSDKLRSEKSIKQFLITASGDRRIPKKVYQDTLQELHEKDKQIEHQIHLGNANIKMLTQRIEKNIIEESELKQGVKLFDKAEKKIADLLSQNTEESLNEARNIFRESIENIKVTWVEKTREHQIEIQFKKVEGLKKGNEARKISLSATEKVRRIPLPPIDFTFPYGEPVGDFKDVKVNIIRRRGITSAVHEYNADLPKEYKGKSKSKATSKKLPPLRTQDVH